MSAVRFTKKPSMTWEGEPREEAAPERSHGPQAPCWPGPAPPSRLT